MNYSLGYYSYNTLQGISAAMLLIDLKIETQKEILALLKSKRLEIAKAQKVPPYVVFHDKTLLEMIKTKPRSIVD